MRRTRATLVAWFTALFAIGTVGTGAGAALYLYHHLKPVAQFVPPPSPRHLTALAGHTQSYLGVFETGDTASYQPITQFAAAVGRRPNVVSYYSAWGGRFELRFAERAAAHGAAPLVQMLPFHTSMQSIAAGQSDSYLSSYAQQVRAYGYPVIMSFAPEANGWWYPWGWRKTSPADWVAAWRHVVTVFRQQGATNVTWLWTMNRSVNRGLSRMGPVADYWPGAAYVDWVGIDGYYFTAAQDFSTVFAPTIKAIRALTGKPIFMSEVGIGQISGQVTKIPDLFAGIRKYHLIGLLWFDVAQHAGPFHQNWRLEGHPGAVAAFRQGLASINGS